MRDERGFFARIFDRERVRRARTRVRVAQASVSFNARRGTLRGMHLQRRRTRRRSSSAACAGAVYDVVVDLRAGSPTQLAWLASSSLRRRNALYLPPGLRARLPDPRGRMRARVPDLDARTSRRRGRRALGRSASASRGPSRRRVSERDAAFPRPRCGSRPRAEGHGRARMTDDRARLRAGESRGRGDGWSRMKRSPPTR